MFWKNAKGTSQNPKAGDPRDGDAERSRTHGWSIAGRLTALCAGLASAILFCSVAFLYWALVRQLEEQNQGFLLKEIGEIRSLMRQFPNDLEVLKTEFIVEKLDMTTPEDFARVLDEQGRVLLESPRMSEVVPTTAFAPMPPETETFPQFQYGTSAHSKTFLLVSAWGQMGDRVVQKRLIQLALDVTDDQAFIAAYRRRIAWVLALGIVLSTAASAWVARNSLRPLGQIARAVQHITVDQLHARVGQTRWPKELAALAHAFDQMLGRLESSFKRLSQFSSDLAHELRTPVNNLRGEVEVTLSRTRSTEEYREVLASCLEECQRLSQIIDSLLFLARAENPQTAIQRERVEVSRELAAIRDFYEPAASEAGVQLQLEAPEPSWLGLDRTLLQRAVGNLIENALAHTPSGGRVRLSTRSQNGFVRIQVEDNGRGISAEHLPRVFDRFYRADAARPKPRQGSGMGLGLAIVKSIMDLHGGKVAMQSEPHRGTTVTLTFPASAAAVPEMATGSTHGHG